jgi:hypothetical protein
MFTVGGLVGSCSPATDHDGHATKRPSTFFEHRRRLIQPTRKPTDLTNPSTESDQVQDTISFVSASSVVHVQNRTEALVFFLLRKVVAAEVRPDFVALNSLARQISERAVLIPRAGRAER